MTTEWMIMSEGKTTLPKLTVRLEQIQHDSRLTDDGFAAFLGIGGDTWTKLKGGRVGYGSKAIKAVLAKYPEFLPLVLELPDNERHGRPKKSG